MNEKKLINLKINELTEDLIVLNVFFFQVFHSLVRDGFLYNGEKYIAQCIESVLNQTYPNFEYFVCNHGSKDATLSIINKYAEQDSRIKVLDYPNEARGFYPELIAKEGKGKWFAMLDSDDYWAEDNLEKLVAFAEDFSQMQPTC